MEDIRQGVATGQVKMVGVEMWITDRGKCVKTDRCGIAPVTRSSMRKEPLHLGTATLYLIFAKALQGSSRTESVL